MRWLNLSLTNFLNLIMKMIWIWSYCIKIKLVVNKLVVEEGELIESKMCQDNCEK